MSALRHVLESPFFCPFYKHLRGTDAEVSLPYVPVKQTEWLLEGRGWWPAVWTARNGQWADSCIDVCFLFPQELPAQETVEDLKGRVLSLLDS